jgi:23S rRNA pseudouridine1911/1915/1917 synthase
VGKRLEEVMAVFQPTLSRSAVQRLIRRGGVHVNGRLLTRSGLRLEQGARLEINWDAGQERPEAERPKGNKRRREGEVAPPSEAGGAGGKASGDGQRRGSAAGFERATGSGQGRAGQAASAGAKPDSSQGSVQDSRIQPVDPNQENCLEAGEPAHLLMPGLDAERLADLVAQAEALDVIYADDDIVVVNKPAGMLTHATEKQRYGSLADLARLRYGRMPLIMGDDRPGIVHRLDRETSGVIVLARSPEAMDDLREQFRNREIEKVYLAIAHRNADFETAVLDWDIDQKPGGTDRQAYLEKGEGKDALTEVTVEERFGHATLLSCMPRTGRRHQIRVHLYAAGLPIVGDVLYGGRSGPVLPDGAPRMRRHALHAVELTLRHPSTNEWMTFGAELPEDIESLLGWLRGE